MGRIAFWAVIAIGCLALCSDCRAADVTSWGISLLAEAPEQGAFSLEVLVGVQPDATDALDYWDACSTPPDATESVLNLSAYHPEFEDPSGETGPFCQRDFRPPLVSSREWNLLLETNLTNTDIVISWDTRLAFSEVPEEYVVILEDVQAGEILEVTGQGQYVLSAPEVSPSTREFRLRVINEPPSPPADVQATPGRNSVILSWNPTLLPTDVTSLLVELGEILDGSTPVLQFPNTGQAEIEGLEAGKTYDFRISCRDRSGLTGPASETGSFRTLLEIDLDEDGQIGPLDLFSLSLLWQRPVQRDQSLSGLQPFDAEGLIQVFTHWHQ